MSPLSSFFTGNLIVQAFGTMIEQTLTELKSNLKSNL